MKKIVVFGLLIGTLLFTQSCKECEDPEVKPLRGSFFKLDITLMNGPDAIAYDDVIQVDNVEEYRMEVLKYYLSNIQIFDNQGNPTNLEEVVLADGSKEGGMQFTMAAPQGIYDKLMIGVGLDSVLNASDPLQFANEHPLSSAQAMYWSWAMKYRFIRIDGRAKEMSSDPDDILVAYHPGADEFYRVREFPKSFQCVDGDTTTVELKLDVAKWFDGPGGTINVPTENQSHTTPDDYQLALKFVNNFAASLDLK